MFEFFRKITGNIGFELIDDFTNKLTDFIKEVNKNRKDDNDDGSIYSAQIGSSGDFAKIGSAGDYAQIGGAGDYAQIGSAGDYAQIGSAGDYAQIESARGCAKIGSAGGCAKIVSAGESAQIGSSGDFAKIVSAGDSAKIGTLGDYAQIGSAGDYAQIGGAGDSAQIGSAGDYAQIESARGCAKIGSAGGCAKIVSAGESAQIGSAGDYAQINISGERSVGFACGYRSIIKAKKGTWISLCEWGTDKNYGYIPIYALSAQIGNKEYKDFKNRILKETEYYCLLNKKLYPVDISDEIIILKISEKKINNITIIKGLDFNNNNELYLVKENSLNAHGNTLKEALEDLQFKKTESKEVQEIISEIRKTKKVNKAQYRAITGACQYGTNKFCEEHKITTDEIELTELKKILISDYGAEKFWRLIEG